MFGKELVILGLLGIVLFGCAGLDFQAPITAAPGEEPAIIAPERSFSEFFANVLTRGVLSTGWAGTIAALLLSVRQTLKTRGISLAKTKAVDNIMEKAKTNGGAMTEREVLDAIREAIASTGVNRREYSASVIADRRKLGI